MSAYLCDGDLVCDACAVDVTDDDMAIGGECDSPQHCAYCHRPLDDTFELTTEGMRYVMQSVREHLAKGKAWADVWHWEHGYYKGLNRDAVVLDWIDLWIKGGRLDKRDERTCELFVRWRSLCEVES